MKLLAFIPFLLNACSGYQKDFRKAQVPAEGVTGPWKGSWSSEVNGHHGPLWCLVSRDDEKPDQWVFRYRAGWGLLAFGDYRHEVTAVKDGEKLPLDDSMELPGGFGTYEIDGALTPENFRATYRSEKDHGTLVLTRP